MRLRGRRPARQAADHVRRLTVLQLAEIIAKLAHIVAMGFGKLTTNLADFIDERIGTRLGIS
ncbi:MAG: hypothetical protein NTU53_19200 [Planctomycetota bacterium]|nr:hypothetical protein [Planctomycetota bacterium]